MFYLTIVTKSYITVTLGWHDSTYFFRLSALCLSHKCQMKLPFCVSSIIMCAWFYLSHMHGWLDMNFDSDYVQKLLRLQNNTNSMQNEQAWNFVILQWLHYIRTCTPFNANLNAQTEMNCFSVFHSQTDISMLCMVLNCSYEFRDRIKVRKENPRGTDL